LLALGRDREAAEALERLEDPPLVCFPRLSWPDGQRARVRQAWLMRSELAERERDWGLMERCLDEALAVEPEDLVSKARRTWARVQRLHDGAADESDRADLEGLVEEDVTELREAPMSGGAMFYRSRVLEGRCPERAVRDWRALVGQREWLAECGDAREPRLVWLGDRLARRGAWEDAEVAYRGAADAGADVQERLEITRIAKLMHEPPAEQVRACQDAAERHPDSGLWPLLGALAALQSEPPDTDGARELAAEARERGAAAAAIVEALCGVLDGDDRAGDVLSDLLDGGDRRDVPPVVEAGLRLLAGDGDRLAGLWQFRKQAGEEWMSLLPVDPGAALGSALAEARQGDLARAAELAEDLREQGVELQTDEVVRLLCLHAIELASQGRFDEADDAAVTARALTHDQWGRSESDEALRRE
ncbi:MAG: hypothetical protein U9R79_09595, partial [Armatimonadota bacterium]|nr:hypothetical protein [Armatimonadota bacterium]